jgi:hypothetical protein
MQDIVDFAKNLLIAESCERLEKERDKKYPQTLMKSQCYLIKCHKVY